MIDPNDEGRTGSLPLPLPLPTDDELDRLAEQQEKEKAEARAMTRLVWIVSIAMVFMIVRAFTR